jgi:hypothetical protein
MTFAEHKDQTAKDCEAIAKIMTDLAATCREGNMAAFEGMWLAGGTEEGDAKINALREMILLRYGFRAERIEQNARLDRQEEART